MNGTGMGPKWERFKLPLGGNTPVSVGMRGLRRVLEHAPGHVVLDLDDNVVGLLGIYALFHDLSLAPDVCGLRHLTLSLARNQSESVQNDPIPFVGFAPPPFAHQHPRRPNRWKPVLTVWARGPGCASWLHIPSGCAQWDAMRASPPGDILPWKPASGIGRERTHRTIPL